MLAWGQLARPGPKLPKLDREPTILFPLADRQTVCSARNMRNVERLPEILLDPRFRWARLDRLVKSATLPAMPVCVSERDVKRGNLDSCLRSPINPVGVS